MIGCVYSAKPDMCAQCPDVWSVLIGIYLALRFHTHQNRMQTSRDNHSAFIISQLMMVQLNPEATNFAQVVQVVWTSFFLTVPASFLV